ncbi:MAG: delta-60 repeat domain-containing protein, partial [Ferruginibacter sp.]
MKKFLSGCLFLCALNLCYSQSATLDPAFGTRGIVKTDMGTSYNYNGFARQVLTQPGGAIYILLNGNFPGSVISKRLASGAIDSTYGINGYSGSVPVTEAFAALQPDGKIVIAGVAGNNSFVTERLKSNGTPDSSFGTYGIKVTEFNGASFARSVVIQSDGKIVVAGHTADNSKAYFAVVRYNPNGSNDNSFNGNGKALTDFMF